MRFSNTYIILGIFLLSSCGTTAPIDTPITAVNTGNIANVPFPDYETTLKNTSAVIKNSQEFKECMAPAVNMCENSVGMRMAQEKKSVDICNELTQEANRESCNMVIISLLAQEKNDITACDTLSENGKYSCRTQYIRRNAVNLKSTQECGKIGDEIKKTSISGEMLTLNMNQSVDQCKLEVIQSQPTATPQDCDILADEMMKRMCSDTIIHRQEIQKMMLEMKADIPTPEIQ